MKIVEIIPQLSYGGAEKFTVNLCNALSKTNDVTLIVLHNLEKYGQLRNELSNCVDLIGLNKNKGVDFQLFWRLYKLIKTDVVHTHLSGIPYIILAAYLLPQIKYIHTIHNEASKEALGIIKKISRMVLFKTHKVIPVTISDDSRRSFFEYYKTDSVLIYNGSPEYNGMDIEQKESVLSELYGLKKNKFSRLFVNVARMQPQKNQIALCKAVHSLNIQGYNIELLIIGRKDIEIASCIESLKSPYIHLLGVRKNPVDYMYLSDAFILSSVYEGMPITLIECFSVGVIPVCTPVGGIINMIEDGVNGILAKGVSQKDIEDAILRFLNMSEIELAGMKQKSADSFLKYTLSVCAQNYIQLMDSLIRENRRV